MKKYGFMVIGWAMIILPVCWSAILKESFFFLSMFEKWVCLITMICMVEMGVMIGSYGYYFKKIKNNNLCK